jgi:hypothetical protein
MTIGIKLSDLANGGSERLYGGGSATFDERGGAVDDWFTQQGAPGGFQSASEGPQGRGSATGGGPLTNAQAEQFFNQLFPGETVSPEDLEAHRAELEAAGFQLNPNAAGRITDLRLPSGDYVDPIYGAGAGLNRKQWNIEGPGTGGGGIGAGLETSPGYQFRLGEGLKALERSAAARGTLLTGGTAKGLQRYAQDYASGEYGTRVNQLANLAELGYGAAGQQAGLGSSYAGQAGSLLGSQATNIGDLYTQQGNAAAAGTVGSANAWQQPLNFGTNLAQMYFLSRLYGGGGGTATGGAATGSSAGAGGLGSGRPLAMGNPSVPGFAGWAQTYDPRYTWLGNVPGYAV